MSRYPAGGSTEAPRHPDFRARPDPGDRAPRPARRASSAPPRLRFHLRGTRGVRAAPPGRRPRCSGSRSPSSGSRACGASRAARLPSSGRSDPSWRPVAKGASRYRGGPRRADGAFRPGWPQSWMNAIVDGEPVTPRYGRAVEVNALWHAALKASARLERLAEERGAPASSPKAWHVAQALQRSVLVRGAGAPVRRRRPGAARLEPAPQSDLRRLAVGGSAPAAPGPSRCTGRCATYLLTPLGLRTLDPVRPALPRPPLRTIAWDDRARSRSTREPRGPGCSDPSPTRTSASSAAAPENRAVLCGPGSRDSEAHVRGGRRGLDLARSSTETSRTLRAAAFAEARSVGEIARVLYDVPEASGH